MIKVAIIGAGYMAKEHIKVFIDIDGVEVSGIFSRTFENASNLAKQFGINYIASSVNDLYENTKADIVVNSVSVLSIFETSILCMNFPWICLIEKPAGYNYEEALALNDYATKKGARVYVALNRRHYSSTRQVISDLKKDSSSRVINVLDQQDLNDSKKLGLGPIVQKNWMYGNSVHLVDYFSIFCRGSLKNIVSSSKWDLNYPFLVSAKLEYDSGDVGFYQDIWNAPSPWSVSVTNKNSRWEMRPLEVLTKQNYSSRIANNVKIDFWDSKFKPGLRMQAKLIIDSLDDDKSSLPTISQALTTMNNIKNIYNLEK